jgi:multiple sugar transport system permease protein
MTNTDTGAAVRQSRRRKGGRGVVWAVTCTVIGVLFAFPFYVVLTAALKTPTELVAIPPTLVPSAVSLENFFQLGSLGNGIWVHLGNSAFLALFTVLGTLIVSTLAGWSFARFPFRGQSLLFIGILAAIMVPFQALLTPLFLILKTIGLGSSLIGLGLVYIVFQLPFAIFVMRNAFLDVPQALEDAARVDGAGGVQLFRHVLLPVVRPGMITVALFAFFSAWNEYLAALVLLSKQELFPLPVALTGAIISGLTGVNWSLLQAGVVVTMLPCLILFFTLQRYYVTGLAAGAVKD